MGRKHAHEHALNEAQMEALGTIAVAMGRVVWRRICCMGYGVGGGETTFILLRCSGSGCGEVRRCCCAGDGPDAGDDGADGGGVRERGGVAALAVDAG